LYDAPAQQSRGNKTESTMAFRFAALLTLFAGAAAAEGALTILHINDFHSRVEPVTRSGAPCGEKDAAEGKCFGGAARLATAVATARAAAGNAPVLMLNAGDVFQGSLFYTRYKGMAEVDLLAGLGTDAMVLGNHEFDDGPEALAPFVNAAAYPVIGGNVDVSAEPLLAGRIPESVVIEVGGERVGIVGALATDTVETSSPGPNVRFAPVIDSLTAQVAAMQAQGVSRIVALTHVGIEQDIAIARAVPGIDAIIGGHSHTVMANGVEGAQPYPLMVEGPEGRAVPIAHAGANGVWLGRLEVTFDADGRVTAAGGNPILLEQSIPEDPAVATRVAELAEPLQEVRDRVVAEATAPIDGDRAACRARECEMGALVAEAMLERVKDQGARIAIQNGGGLRASIDAGPVTMGEVLTVLPFGNTLATFTLTGADVIAALENGLSQVEEGAGRFPQVAGLRFTWDRAKPAGARVVSVEVKDGGGWAPLDPAADYLAVTNDYMRRGGDGYQVFAEKGRDAYDFGPALDEVVAAYLAANGPYAPALRGATIEVQAP
jgi:5'-nucleotidase